MRRWLLVVLLFLAVDAGWAAPLFGGMVTYQYFSGRTDISVSEEDYRFHTTAEGDLIVHGTGKIGTPMSFDTTIGSLYTVEAVVGDTYYPLLYVSPPVCCTERSVFFLDTDEIVLTEAFVYRVPFTFFGSIAAYGDLSNPGECILCVGVRASGVGTVTTWAPTPDTRIPSLMTFAWGDYANIPEPSTFSLGVLGTLAFTGYRLRVSRKRRVR